MANPTRYDPAKHYTLSGATLNSLYETLEGLKILEAPGYRVSQSPGIGQKLKIDLTAAIESRWDLVAGTTAGTHVLRAPLVVEGVNKLADEITINNTAITLAADKWVTLRVDDLAANPYTFTLTLSSAETDGSLKVYTFNSSDVLTAVALPLYRCTDTALPGSVQFGANLHLTRYIYGEVMALASHFVVVPDRPIGRFVPRLVAL
jgi:hypothetical protein